MEERLTVALGTENFCIPMDVLDRIKEDMMEVLSKYVCFQGSLNTEIEKSVKGQEFILVISGQVRFRQ